MSVELIGDLKSLRDAPARASIERIRRKAMREALVSGFRQCTEGHGDCIEIMTASFPTKRQAYVTHWNTGEWMDFCKRSMECCLATSKGEKYVERTEPEPCPNCQAEAGSAHAQWCEETP